MMKKIIMFSFIVCSLLISGFDAALPQRKKRFLDDDEKSEQKDAKVRRVQSKHKLRRLPGNVEAYLLNPAFPIVDPLLRKLIRAYLCQMSNEDLARCSDQMFASVQEQVKINLDYALSQFVAEEIKASLRDDDNFDLLFDIVLGNPTDRADAIKNLTGSQREKCPVCFEEKANVLQLDACKHELCIPCACRIFADATGSVMDGVVAKPVAACPICREPFSQEVRMRLAKVPEYDAILAEAQMLSEQLGNKEAAAAQLAGAEAASLEAGLTQADIDTIKENGFYWKDLDWRQQAAVSALLHANEEMKKLDQAGK